MRLASLGLVIALAAAGSATAEDLDHGRRLAERWCAECHAVADKPTRFRRSLPFAAIAAKDGVTLETLTAFLLLPHATMSNAPLSRQDAADLAAYIMALKK
ncbi:MULTISPECIES: cytochrome c [unclassified Bradyrhizobium]|uniref:cytochrome c n=1 Tax=unclassified Bradyrhizobium TaxID=2631580 RepID=UPI0028E1BFE0|nr:MULTISPECIES: cytochrome c [unclassified Bradyrhizobium]